jgi:hypothetical protein
VRGVAIALVLAAGCRGAPPAPSPSAPARSAKGEAAIARGRKALAERESARIDAIKWALVRPAPTSGAPCPVAVTDGDAHPVAAALARTAPSPAGARALDRLAELEKDPGRERDPDAAIDSLLDVKNWPDREVLVIEVEKGRGRALLYERTKGQVVCDGAYDGAPKKLWAVPK